MQREVTRVYNKYAAFEGLYRTDTMNKTYERTINLIRQGLHCLFPEP